MTPRAAATLDRADEAFEHLERAVRAGYNHKAWIENDSDFDSVREDPCYQVLLDSIQQA